jgi:hypothetical protein
MDFVFVHMDLMVMGFSLRADSRCGSILVKSHDKYGDIATIPRWHGLLNIFGTEIRIPWILPAYYHHGFDFQIPAKHTSLEFRGAGRTIGLASPIGGHRMGRIMDGRKYTWIGY